MLFAFIIILGQLVFALGGFLNRLWVMEVGRFVFGIGGESLAVAQNTYAVSWFKGKELNMVFGFQVKLPFTRIFKKQEFICLPKKQKNYCFELVGNQVNFFSY